MIIRSINKDEIDHLITESVKDGLKFCDQTILLGVFLNGNIIAFSGFIEKNNKVIFKNHFVTKKHRGKGIFKAMLRYLMNKFKGKKIEATCTQMSIKHYIEQGFKIVKIYKNGCTKVARNA